MKKTKLLLITLCCLVGLSCFCNAETIELNNLVGNFICENGDCYVETPIISNPFLGYTGGNIDLSCKVNYLATSNCNNTNICFNGINDGNVILDITMLRTNGVMNYLWEDSNMDTFNTYYTIINNENIEDYIIEGNIPSDTYATYLMLFPSRPENTTNENDKDGTIGFNCLLSGDFGTTIPSNGSSCPSCPSCPSQFTSLECQSEYSLIPISSVDSTYCENNNLCSSSSVDCPSGDYSSIYVNGVLHDPAPIIDIQISDEIDWDYAYSGSGSQFNLDIVGYNVDYEKMGEVLLVQNYKPSSEDFTNLISSLVPYMKILVFVLFAYIVIKRLKKPFSSKLK